MCVVATLCRVRKDHYKGMSEAERRAIQATQMAQLEEKKARQAAQAAEEAQYARTQADILRAMDAQVRAGAGAGEGGVLCVSGGRYTLHIPQQLIA